MEQYKDRLRGMGMSVMFLSIFGTCWSLLGINGLNHVGQKSMTIMALLIFAGLSFAGLLLLKSSRKIPHNEPLNSSKIKLRRRFRFIFLAEMVSIIAAIVICRSLNHPEYIPIVILMIVGCHFLPLAKLFHIKIYFLTGMLLFITALFTWAIIPKEILTMSGPIDLQYVIVGFGSAIILWATSLAIFVKAIKLLPR